MDLLYAHRGTTIACRGFELARSQNVPSFLPTQVPFVCFRKSGPLQSRCAQPQSVRACAWLAIDDVWSAVYGDTLRIMKDNFGTMGNFLWINSAISFMQPRGVPSCIRA